MSLETIYEAVLGPQARRGQFEWAVRDAESARLAVQIAVDARAAISPGYPQPGRLGLHPPEGILTLWPDELVARIGAGTTLAQIEAALTPHGLSLGLEVPDPAGATLGACYADGRAGFAGPRGYRLRDRCVGLSFVDGSARVLAAGSRLVKNVAGYDFGRLHHAARGSLGLVLDLTVRLIRRPAARCAVWWPCRCDELAERLPEIRDAWGSDAIAEVCLDRVAAVRFGLPGAGVVIRHFGDPDLTAARISRSNAVDVSARWDELLARSSGAARPMPVSRLSVREPGQDWVADVGCGNLRQAGQRIITDSPSRAALAVKRVLDPHGIWPALPGQAEEL
ncbi:hypothetical protein DRQ53_00920 [bacterium]|nr:MAG: hypothetical protein DRQ53_00920 [bacterium]